MLMFDCLKRKVHSKLIFQFMKKSKKPQYIEVLNLRKEIPKNQNEIEIEFVDFSINDYKVYNCKAKYLDNEETSSASIYYNKTNYFQCGDGKDSVEIIFSDFMNKSLKKEDCIIEYDGLQYLPTEDFGLLTRKRINFINIDFNKLKLPKDLNGKEININSKDNNNYLISISMIDKPKIIAIYLNNPFIEMKLNHTEKDLIKILQSSLENISKIVYLNENENYSTYHERGKKNIFEEYVKEIKKSYKIEVKISEYFLIPREKLISDQIEIYKLYSDFMVYFPDIGISSRETDKINGFRYYHQYFFSKLSLNHFYSTFPNFLDESDKVKLKYSASRCLRTLLSNGTGENHEELFEFIDFTKANTIYFDANSFNRKFINSLNEKSEIFLYFLQISSGSSINLITNELMGRISMLDEKIIKEHLISTIPKYAIKMLVNPSFNACSFSEVKVTCINEMSVLDKVLKGSGLSSFYDSLYNRRFLLANLLQHEDFGHLNFSLNFYAFYDKNIQRPSSSHYSENLSPFKYLMINKKKEEIQEIVKETRLKDKKGEKDRNNEVIIKGESGIALSFFLTRGRYKLMKVLRGKSIDFSELFAKPELLAAEDLTEFIDKLNEIYLSNEYLFINDNDNSIEYKTRFQDSQSSNPIPYGMPTIEKF